MRKIAFFISEICRGGAERVLVNLANNFAKNGDEIFFITTKRVPMEYSLCDSIQRISIDEKIELSTNKILKVIQEIRFIRNICNKKDIDILISFMANNNFKSVIACLGVCKTLISVRNYPPKEYYNFLLKLCAKLIYPFADGYVFQTTEEAKFFPKFYRKKSEIIYNPVSSRFFNKSIHVEEREGIVAVGRLEEQKNYKMLVASYGMLAQKGIKEKLYIYGDGSQRHDLEKIISEKGLGDYIFLKGKVSNVEDVVKKAKLFVMTSIYEGMPNALMEAMALGVPVVCTNCLGGGPRELIKDGENGFLVNRNDSKDFAEKMYTVIKSLDIQKKFSKNAKKTSVRFKDENVMCQWKELVNKVCK